ncbi:TetR family transcriptional regulator [Ramlibacter rhizophilus]|uniref:TetR family transcriptional regulator n=1 Tax=Ramlibacter rhizophilus TaxID=1781167 RepID=A0A4Z0BB95_9BURK|nr:TetR family transcriptional regulator [Ramlibacter rhizophilus]TFY96382.1 TetR family transcriptional regulator [Ramlibacter rhizophilus]
MPRRTKEEALETRNALLDAAECVFQRKGVSASSLADIAAEAGASRGAIYWHFKDKADLFNAMMERVSLPLEHALHDSADEPAPDPLAAMRGALLQVLHSAAHDPRTRRVFEVATHKVEYVEALGSVRARHLAVRNGCLGDLEQVLRRAAAARGRALPDPVEAARGLHALVDGLIQNWMLDPGAFDLERAGGAAIDTYLAGLGLDKVATPAPAIPRRTARTRA